ncbi:MAG: metallophosphoesterase family protein [Candidatus Hodarchaeales archaeon]
MTSQSETWHFVVIGDTRQPLGFWNDTLQHYSHDNTSNPIRAALFNSIVDNNPNIEFIIHTGDVVASGGEQDDWDRYFEDIENVTENNISIYYGIGNHERYMYALGPGNYAPPDENYTTYLANVDFPSNERYYSFDYNNQIHFVFINTEENWDHDFLITPDQETWLVNDLDNNSIDFVVAVFHRPAYSVRDYNRIQDANRVRSVLEPIFQQFDVDLVFSGHDHYYYRTIRNETVYITAAGGGAELYSNNDLSEWQDDDVFFSDYHYMNVTVSHSADTLSLKIDALVLNDDNKTTTLADSYQVSIPYSEISTTPTSTSTSVTSTSSSITTTSEISTTPTSTSVTSTSSAITTTSEAMSSSTTSSVSSETLLNNITSKTSEETSTSEIISETTPIYVLSAILALPVIFFIKNRKSK